MTEMETALAEVARELRVREKVYPRLVFSGKLSQQEADRRRLALTAAHDLLAKALDASRTPYPTSAE